MGRLAAELAKLPQTKVVLTDISYDMLNLATDRCDTTTTVPLVNADAHELPFSDSSFTLLVGLDLLCHLERPYKALLDFYRVLKPGGVLIIDSTNSSPLWTFFYPRYLGKNPLNWLRIIRFKGVYPGWQMIVKHYPKKQFLSFLKDAGFKVLRTINYGPLICPKWHLAVTRKI
jgi:ubiquinone/menaquinone biosynthesis C-methylase UbiE